MADSASPTTPATIRLHGVTKAFGGRTVVDVPDLTLGSHPIEGLIGPNGAGKTTLMRLVMHSIPLDSGSITFHSSSGTSVVVSTLQPPAIPRLGLVKTNQVIQDFGSLTIWDSLLLAVATARYEQPHRIFSEHSLVRRHEDEIHAYLDKFEFDDPYGYARSGGEKKLLDILRCLLLKPQMLLLDEPTAGLPDDVAERVMELIVDRATAGTSVVLVEHDLDVVWHLSQYVHFMAEGRVQLQGPPSEVRAHATVIEKYLGAGHA
jgi:ABC-type branched-subunit amino acid transport system ATPase component